MADVIEHRGAVRPMARCSPQPVGQRHIGFSGRADGPQKTSLSAFSSARLVRCCLLLLLLILQLQDMEAVRRRRDHPDGQGVPQRVPTHREAADSGVRDKDALTMPWFPWHTTSCSGRPCKPGEGNLKHVREQTSRGWRYKQWSQPYIHREDWVQSRSRSIPHAPDARSTYFDLIKLAQQISKENLVIVTSGDWDYRELVLNWFLHVHQLKYYNALVLAMDSELTAEVSRRRLPVFDDSALLQGWNNTCLQRHIQQVRCERHIGVAALVAAGIDVLHSDATCIFLRDFVPSLQRQFGTIDLLVQRDEWPTGPVRTIGSSANAGFYLVRGTKGAAAADVLVAAVDRGLIEFYLRWNNIPDQYGISFVLADVRLDARTTPISNDTTVGLLHPRHSKCKLSGTCLNVGFLPYDRFPRTGDWNHLRSRAEVYHLTYSCTQEEAPCSVPGIRPFRGYRQRLDRYDDVDFDDMRQTLRAAGLWLLDKSPDYMYRRPAQASGIAEL